MQNLGEKTKGGEDDEKGYKMYVEPTIPTLNSLQVLLLDGKQPCILAELASQETVSLSLFLLHL